MSRTTAVAVFEQLTAEELDRLARRGGRLCQRGAERQSADQLQARPWQPAPSSADAAGPATQEASEQYFPRLIHPARRAPFVTGTPAYRRLSDAAVGAAGGALLAESRRLMLGYPEPAA